MCKNRLKTIKNDKEILSLRDFISDNKYRHFAIDMTVVNMLRGEDDHKEYTNDQEIGFNKK